MSKVVQSKSIEDLIGNTPLMKLSSFSEHNFELYAKLEGQNPGGSIKDRVALALLDSIEKKYGDLKNKIIIEPSSGNTGIGLAMIGTQRGLKIKIILPQNASKERIKMLKILGAKIEFCQKEEWQGNLAIEKVKKMAQERENYIMPNQYENPACIDVHYEKTGPEIIKDCPKITHLVATIGTGGTIVGISKRLKNYNPKIKIIGVEVRKNSKIPGPRSLEDYQPPILNFDKIDERIKITKKDEEKVFELQKKLSQKEGIFYGLSSAAALWGALNSDLIKKARKQNQLLRVVIIFPDRGDRYLSLL